MIRALIITYYWPPAGGSGVQRWLKFVKYLRNFDIEPIVYTVQNPDYVFTDPSLENDIPENTLVIKQPIWEPYQLANIFSKKKKIESAGFIKSNQSLGDKIKSYVRANYFIPDARIFWIKPSVKFLSNYLLNNHIDIIISTGPPHSMHLIAHQLKNKFGLKWIADFRDPWTDIDYFHHLPLTKKSIAKHCALEQMVLKNADEVIVVGNSMKENYLPFTKNIHVISNGFDNETVSINNSLDFKFSITHVGLMNADRNHPFLWKVLADIASKNEDFKSDLVIKLIGKVDESVVQSINQFGLSNNLDLVPYLPHDEVIQLQLESQLLLLSINNVPAARGIITGKVFEYLQTQRPILAIAPTNGDLAEILNETNAGTVIDFDDEKHLIETINQYYSFYKQGILEVKSQNFQQYHRKNLTQDLSNLIKKCVYTK